MKNLLSRVRKQRLVSVFALTMLTLCVPALGAVDEFRAMWVSRFGSPAEWVSSDQNVCKAKINDIINKLAANNFNAVIFQMRGQCDTLYYSPYEPYSPLVSSNGNEPPGWAGFDPMAYAINAAHAKGIEFHAYLNAHVCWGGGAPTYCNWHIFWEHCNVNDPQHRDWLLCNSNGVPYAPDGEYIWIAPGIPDFQAYWRKQIMYVVKKYDGSDPVTRPAIDGVHFDRMRTPGSGFSYDPISQSRRLGDANPGNLSFADWQRDQFTRVLIDLYAEINEYTTNQSPTHHPVKVSSAPLGMHSGPRYIQYGYPQGDCSYGGYGYSCSYQDPQTWLAVGAQDFIVPQIYWADPPYRTSNPNFSEILPDWLEHNSGRHVYPGINTSATGPGLVSEINVTRSMAASEGNGNAPGTTVWSFSSFNNNGYWDDLSGPGGPYREPANVPAMPWKENPTDAIILGTVTDGAGPIVDVHVTRTGSTYTALSSADGLYAFLKVPPGDYTLTYTKSGFAGTTRQVSVVAGQVLRVPEVVLGGPVISNVQATSITNNAATITWTTDVAADSQVEYGTTAAYGSTTPLNSTLVTSHSVNLTGLAALTTYHYRVISTANGETSYSDDFTLTTSGPPAISNVQSSAVTATGATITWTTNTASNSRVRYGLTSSYGSQTTLDPAAVTSHSVTLSGLTPSTTYHYQAVSANAYGTANSADYTFTTSGPPVISNVAAGNIGSNSATITWTTNALSDSQVEYGLTTSYGSSSTLNPALVTSHSVALSGLSPTTLYHYRVRSANGAGTTYSGDATFTTTAVPQEIVIDNLDSGCTASGSWSTGSNPDVPKIGTNYLYKAGTPGGTATVRWTPTIVAAGNYDVWVFYQMGTNRNPAAAFKVVYDGGTLNSVQNQYRDNPNRGDWFKLNSTPLPFGAGTAGYVEVSNNSTSTAYVSADAAKFVRVGGDALPPTVPTNLTATAVSTTSIQLNWTASTDNIAVAGYNIYRNGVQIGTSASTGYLDSGLTANTSYSYEISAYDAVPNESNKTAPLSRATHAVPPSAGSVTANTATVCTDSNVVWTAVGGFGPGKVQLYRYAWDQSAAHVFNASEPQWSSGTLTTVMNAPGTWYLHVQSVNVDGIANAAFDYAVSNPCRSIVQWRSVHTHGGSTAIGIELLATGSTTEPRSGGLQRIEIDFNEAVTLGSAAAVQVIGRTTSGGTMGDPVAYTPQAVSLADADTMAITFAPGALPDATCYTISLLAGAIQETLTGDIDCNICALLGDATANGTINLGDALYVRAAFGHPAYGYAWLDIDRSGTIDSADTQAVKARITSPAIQAACP